MAQSITVRSFAAGAQPITRSVDRSLAASKIPKSPHTYYYSCRRACPASASTRTRPRRIVMHPCHGAQLSNTPWSSSTSTRYVPSSSSLPCTSTSSSPAAATTIPWSPPAASRQQPPRPRRPPTPLPRALAAHHGPLMELRLGGGHHGRRILCGSRARRPPAPRLRFLHALRPGRRPSVRALRALHGLPPAESPLWRALRKVCSVELFAPQRFGAQQALRCDKIHLCPSTKMLELPIYP